MSSIFSMLGPIIFWFLEKWANNQKKKKEFQESYYAFLAAVDKSGAVKTANHLAAQDALKAEQDKLLKELENGNSNQETNNPT